MRLLWIILMLIPIGCISQYTYQYSGAPKAVFIDSIGTLPNSTFRIDFCTQSVPDQLTIYTETDSLEFYVGSMVITDPSTNRYCGFAEFIYGDTLQILTTDNGSYPANMKCDRRIGGLMRLHYTEKSCWLRFKVSGNVEYPTVYQLNIDQITSGQYISDTTYIDTCGPFNDRVIYENCAKHRFIFRDSSIKSVPIIVNPSCIGKSDGSISFPDHPQYNVVNAPEGQYKIKVENSVCAMEYSFDLCSENICNWYAPNVFSPNDDGVNDVFLLFTPSSTEYDLNIFDRWGSLVYSGSSIQSNVEGWHGNDYPSGVYTWVIKCKSEIIFGNVTLIR